MRIAMHISKTKKLQYNEYGFASLVVGLILIVVLGLITVGFAKLSRHEQEQALSNQLATEAYYAAESGVNDIANNIENGNITLSTPNVDKNLCLQWPLPGMPLGWNIINSPDDVSFSCALVYLKTPTLKYNPLNVEDSRTVVSSATNPANGNPLTNITIHWGSGDQHAKYPPLATNFPPTTTWNASANPALDYLPVLQFSITPLSNTMTRTALINDAFTVFLYPSPAAGNTVRYNTANVVGNDGAIVPGSCNVAQTPYDCSVTIQNVTGTGQYLLHIFDLYDEANVEITGTDGANPVTFSGGQAQIDVTGKAQDVLKRVNVSIPLGSTAFPSYAIEAQNICKRIETGPVSAANPIPTVFSDPAGATGDAIGDPCGLENIN